MSNLDVPDECGLFEKYSVVRLDGKQDGPYFVLSADDPYAPAALATYADQCRATHPQLADDLVALAATWRSRQKVLREITDIKDVALALDDSEIPQRTRAQTMDDATVPVAPYGNRGPHRQSAPQPDRKVSYRYGIRVDSDVRGPQVLPGYLDSADVTGGGRDEATAAIAARRDADSHRAALRELGVDDPVIPWVQRVVVESTVTFFEHVDLKPRT